MGTTLYGDSIPLTTETVTVPTAGPGEIPIAVSVDIPSGVPGFDVTVRFPDSAAGIHEVVLKDLSFSDRDGQVAAALHELGAEDPRPQTSSQRATFRLISSGRTPRRRSLV